MAEQTDEQPRKKGVNLGDLGFKPIPVALANGETVEFGFLTAADERFLVSLLAKDMAAREFVAAFLHHQLIAPQASAEDVQAWSDADLSLAARTYAAASPAGFGNDIAPEADVYETFRTTTRHYHEKLVASVKRTLDTFNASYADWMKPVFGSSNWLASSMGTALMSDQAKVAMGLVDPTQATMSSLRHFGLSGLASGLHDDVGARLDKIANVMAGSLTAQTLAMIEGLSSSAATSIRAMNGELFGSISALIQPISIETFIPTLPDFAESMRRLVKSRDGAAALDDSRFSYSYALWTMEFLIGLSDIDPSDRPDGVFRELKAFTESDEFETELEGYCADPSGLAMRWAAIQEAIEAHRQGRYYSSISILLPLVEGIINDILTILGAVVREKNRFFEKNVDGTKGRELKGLDNKSALARRLADMDMDLAKFVARFLVPERNGILHGAVTDFGRAELSVHLMVVILWLTSTVNGLEIDAKQTA